MILNKNITHKLTINRFKTLENDFNKIHSYYYNYDKSIYSGSKNKIIVNCIKHGDFKIQPVEHLRGVKCYECNIDNKTKTTNLFVIEASSKHNGFYSYSNAIYTKASNKIIITCPIHGDFKQEANSHLSGKGCSICNNNLLTKEIFLKKAKLQHNNKYKYINLKNLFYMKHIDIICTKHGVFNQIINNHLSGNGCKICAKTKYGWTRKRFKNKNTILYLLYIKSIDSYKIGITTKTVRKRYYKDISIKEYDILFQKNILNGAIAFDIEKKILSLKNITKYIGISPFKYTGILEIINENPIKELIKEIEEYESRRDN